MRSTCQLIRQSDRHVLVSHVEVASSFVSRLRGLMGRRSLLSDEALFLPNCQAIHTCFMRFIMDAVFLDRQMRVVKVLCELKPFRIIAPVWSAWGVLELAGGQSQQLQIVVGDLLGFDPC